MVTEPRCTASDGPPKARQDPAVAASDTGPDRHPTPWFAAQRPAGEVLSRVPRARGHRQRRRPAAATKAHAWPAEPTHRPGAASRRLALVDRTTAAASQPRGHGRPVGVRARSGQASGPRRRLTRQIGPWWLGMGRLDPKRTAPQGQGLRVLWRGQLRMASRRDRPSRCRAAVPEVAQASGAAPGPARPPALAAAPRGHARW